MLMALLAQKSSSQKESQYTPWVPSGNDLDTGVTALHRLLCERQPPPEGLPAGEPEEALVNAHLERVSADRFKAMEAFLAEREAAAPGTIAPIDALALRLLLDDYIIAVDRLRSVTQVTRRALDHVGVAVRQSQRAQQRLRAAMEAAMEKESDAEQV
jgi:hypothetical protein